MTILKTIATRFQSRRERGIFEAILLASIWGGLLLWTLLLTAMSIFESPNSPDVRFSLGLIAIAAAGLYFDFGWTVPAIIFGTMAGIGFAPHAEFASVAAVSAICGGFVGLVAGLALDLRE